MARCDEVESKKRKEREEGQRAFQDPSPPLPMTAFRNALRPDAVGVRIVRCEDVWAESIIRCVSAGHKCVRTERRAYDRDGIQRSSLQAGCRVG